MSSPATCCGKADPACRLRAATFGTPRKGEGHVPRCYPGPRHDPCPGAIASRRASGSSCQTERAWDSMTPRGLSVLKCRAFAFPRESAATCTDPSQLLGPALIRRDSIFVQTPRVVEGPVHGGVEGRLLSLALVVKPNAEQIPKNNFSPVVVTSFQTLVYSSVRPIVLCGRFGG